MSRHLLVVGGQRCGSTYLAGLLDAHPGITMARPSRPEPKVFCSEEATTRGAEWYRRSWFDHAGDEAFLGEKSASYLETPQAPARAARMLGHVEVVAILRDPVDRAVSNWRFSTDHGLETRPLATALRENLVASEPWDPTLTSASPFAYVERGRYAAHLRPWVEQFPESTHVLFLPELVPPEHGHAPGSDPLADLVTALGLSSAPLPPRDGARINTSETEASPLSEGLVADLRRHYAESDAALRELLRRDLPWPTDDNRQLHQKQSREGRA